MMKRVLLAGLLGGLVGFLWGFVSWTVLPWHLATSSAFQDEAPVVEAMKAQAQGPGFYMVPAPPDAHGDTSAEAGVAYAARMAEGPVAYVVYDPAGEPMMHPAQMGVGLLIEVALAALMAGLMTLVLPTLPTLGRRVVFAACLGGIAALAGPLTLWNWMHYPTPWSAVNVVDTVAHFTLMGLVVAALIRPRR